MKPKDEQKARPDVLFVGIALNLQDGDLFEPRHPEWIESYVGCRKTSSRSRSSAKPVLFGAEALQHRLSLDLCKPHRTGHYQGGDRKQREGGQGDHPASHRPGKTPAGPEDSRGGRGPADSLKVN